MSFKTMHHLNVFSKSFDSGTDLYPIHSPASPPSSPGSSIQQRHALGRRRKIASESISSDLFRRTLGHPSPDSVNTRMFAMPEEGTSSADEDHVLQHSTRSMGPGYLLLTAKDRLKSASLEWTMSNGSVTPRAPHYHTHPPLDFKSLKEKLRQLTGSPDDASKKHSNGASGQERRMGVLNALPVTTNPTGGHSVIDAGKEMDENMETKKDAGASLFQNVPYVTIESVSRRTSEEIESKLITREFGMDPLYHPATEGDNESSDAVQWSDLAQEVAQKDGTLQKILKRHCQELEDLKKQHELQWNELHHRISDSSTEDVQPNDAHQDCRDEEEMDHSPFLPPGGHLMPASPGGVDAIPANDHSMDIPAVVAQSDFSRVEAIDGEGTWRDSDRCVAGNPGGTYGVSHQLQQLAPGRSHLTTPSMMLLQRQMEDQASRQMEPHIWRDLVDRTLNQLKVPSVLPQMEPINWYQQLELSRCLQAAGSLEQKMRQLALQQVSHLEAQHAQSINFRYQRFPNHLDRPCDSSSQSFPPYVQEHSYSAEPYTVVNWNGHPGMGHAPNYTHGLPPFPQPIHQSPCSEVSSYYRPGNPAFASRRQGPLCCTPDQMACLLEAARHNLLPPSPVIMTPPPTPLYSHLVARQSPMSLDGSYPPSLRHTPQGHPMISPLTAFPFPSTYTVTPEILSFLFPLNPFAN